MQILTGSSVDVLQDGDVAIEIEDGVVSITRFDMKLYNLSGEQVGSLQLKEDLIITDNVEITIDEDANVDDEDEEGEDEVGRDFLTTKEYGL